MKEIFRPYFKTEKYHFSELSSEQKDRGKKIISLIESGLGESPFAYVPLSLEILQGYLNRGKFEDFPGNSFVEVPNLKPDEQLIQYYPNKNNIQAKYLEVDPSFDPKKAAAQQAEEFAQVHYAMTALQVPITRKDFFEALRILIWAHPDFQRQQILKAKKFILESIAEKSLGLAIKEAANFKGYILTLDQKVKGDSAIEVISEFDPETDVIISGQGIPERYLLGLKALGSEEKEYLESLHRKLKE